MIVLKSHQMDSTVPTDKLNINKSENIVIMCGQQRKNEIEILGLIWENEINIHRFSVVINF